MTSSTIIFCIFTCKILVIYTETKIDAILLTVDSMQHEMELKDDFGAAGDFKDSWNKET